MHICMCVDSIGTATRSSGDEYENIEAYTSEHLHEGMPTFQRAILPQALLITGPNQQRCDLYVWDTRNLISEGAALDHWLAPLGEAIKARQATLFLFWSSSTAMSFWAFVEQQNDAALRTAKNVLCIEEPDIAKKLRTWFKLDQPLPILTPLKLHEPEPDDTWGDLLD